MTDQFRANGKLLLTGEYAVLDGATALSFPTLYGQTLHVKENPAFKKIVWNATQKGATWFSATFCFPTLHIETTSNQEKALQLRKVLLKAFKLANIKLTEESLGLEIVTDAEFPINWGLGTSSTLISLIAQWLKINAITLLNDTFGGSGYDVATATAQGPILYKRLTPEKTIVQPVPFTPSFTPLLYFIYLGKKQDSQKQVIHYKNLETPKDLFVEQIDTITRLIINPNLHYNDFQRLLFEHEKITGSILNTTPIKNQYFSDFNGEIKSLGAWGGDFILASSPEEPNYIKNYFKKHNLETIIPFIEMCPNFL